ncbi:MAG TPA: sigma factor [bacterium]|nr:sigma factor [bacterium]
MPEHLDKHRPTPMATTIRVVLSLSGVSADPVDRSDPGLVAWATPLVNAVAQRVVVPPHMEKDDLRQEIWLGVVEALRTYDPARGPLRYWVARLALQHAYGALRWAHRHAAEAEAAEISEVEALLDDLSGSPEDRLFCRQPRARLAYHAARLARSASDAAQTLLRARLAKGNSTAAEHQLAAAGFTPDQVERAHTELRTLGVAALRQVISENRLVFGLRRP